MKRQQIQCIEHGTNNCRCDKAEVTVRNEGKVSEISACERVGSEAEVLADMLQEAKEDTTRHPHVVLGAIREKVAHLMGRNGGMSDAQVANMEDANRMLELLDELDASLVSLMLGASLQGRKR